MFEKTEIHVLVWVSTHMVLRERLRVRVESCRVCVLLCVGVSNPYTQRERDSDSDSDGIYIQRERETHTITTTTTTTTNELHHYL